MRGLVIMAAVVCSCLGEAPYPPSGTKPEGPLLVLPGEYAPPGSVDPRRGDSTVEEANARIMERLRQVEGSERGVYHVYLSDGRLQRVQYTTAPLRQEQQSQEKSQNYYYVRVPEDRLQALRASQAQQQPASSYLPSTSVTRTEPRREEADGKVVRLASVHFMDVEPIPAPIYSYDPKPLARILRKADRDE